MASLLDEARRLIKGGDQSRYEISKATGISQAQLSRLVQGKQGMSVENLEKLADHFGLEIVLRPRKKGGR